MAPGKDNMSESVSVLTQHQLDKFVRDYRIPTDLNPVLPSKDESIYPFRQGKFPLYTRDRRPDLDVFQYFYEFITAGDWHTFAHRKGIPPPSSDERSILKNWKDNFFWLDDRCLPEDMRWRFKDQSMSFDLGEDFVFDQELARALIEHKSLIRPLHEHFLLLGRLCFSWSQGDRVWPVIRRKRDRPFDEASGCFGSRGSTSNSSERTLQYRPSSDSLKSKGITHEVAPQALTRKRETESVQIRPSDPLPLPRSKKVKKGSSHSGSDIMVELDEHHTGGKFSREEAALARSKPTPVFSGGFLPVNEMESMEVENPEVTSTTLGSSLGPDCFVGEEEDQVSSLPPSWFGPELMSFFRYADMFSDDMEIDPTTAEEKFVSDWDIRNKDSMMDELVARTLLFNINTPVDHARSRKMKSQDLGAAVLTNQAQSNVFVTEVYRRWVEAESVRENLEKGTRSLKRKIQKTPEVEKKIAQLTLDLQTHQEKVKSLTIQNQSSQAAAASAAEERDRMSTELKNFSKSMRKKDEEHKSVLAKMEESFNNARLAYANMMAAGCAQNRRSRLESTD
ncbi:hypothetical protein Hdeb2414_s0003g00108291 [Helianthus debilis subsp. tardiflorus]